MLTTKCAKNIVSSTLPSGRTISLLEFGRYKNQFTNLASVDVRALSPGSCGEWMIDMASLRMRMESRK